MRDLEIRYVRYFHKDGQKWAESYAHKPSKYDAYGVYEVIRKHPMAPLSVEEQAAIGTGLPLPKEFRWIKDFSTWSEADDFVQNERAQETGRIEPRPPEEDL
jgi:hypothetical protein